MTPLVKSILGAAAGAVLGYLVYRFVGCRTGTCPITSNPWISAIFGGIMGFMLASGK
jgi:outer membrane lipoprotein SlyB